MMNRYLLSLFLLTNLITAGFSTENWSEFRGPNHSGLGTVALPTIWSDTENLAWKTTLPGKGSSSPIAVDDTLFVTAYSGYGTSIEAPGDREELKLHVICLGVADGSIRWTRTIKASENEQKVTPRVADHGYASPTACADQENVYSEGTVFIAPWNEMITYNILQQSRNYSSKVMEKNGMEIGIDVTINYNPMQNNCSKLHLKHGKAFENSFIDAKVRGVIKDVIGRYTYEEIYSTKREALETEMDTIFQAEFPANFISYNFCEIADVNLPENVKLAITEKETQKQEQGQEHNSIKAEKEEQEQG